MGQINALIGGALAGDQDISTTYRTVILKPNLDGNLNILSLEDFASPNTKYVIKWDYDLQGGTILFPQNCLIQFDGGSLSNGTLIGNNTTVISYLENPVILKNIDLSGTFTYTKYNREQIQGELDELRESITNSLTLTVTEDPFVPGSNQTIVQKYKTITITAGNGSSATFNVIALEALNKVLYTINFNTNGGTLSTYSVTVELGQSITLPVPVWATGDLTFAGWYTNNSFTGTKYTGTYTPSGNVTTINLYAKWIDGYRYYLSNTIPTEMPVWSNSDGEWKLISSLSGWDLWKGAQKKQYISFPRKQEDTQSPSSISLYFYHLDSFLGSLLINYAEVYSEVPGIVVFQWTSRDSLSASNADNLVQFK